MFVFKFEKTQNLPVDIHTAWDFFSSPVNLSKITPPEMDFVITSRLPEKMYPGLIITYTVKPILNIKMQWVTEITQVREPYYFIDEQRSGPYKLWHHQHFFTEIENGVKMDDIIHYKIPFGIFGAPAKNIVVENQLKKIFEFRTKTLLALFGNYKG